MQVECFELWQPAKLQVGANEANSFMTSLDHGPSHGMVSRVPTEDTQERLRKQRLLYLQGPETGGTTCSTGRHQGVHVAEARGGESPGQGLYWYFHRKGRAGHGEQPKTGYFE